MIWPKFKKLVYDVGLTQNKLRIKKDSQVFEFK